MNSAAEDYKNQEWLIGHCQELGWRMKELGIDKLSLEIRDNKVVVRLPVAEGRQMK